MDVDRYILAASGLQHLDEAFNYHLSAIKSPLLVKFGVNVWGDDFDHVRYGLGRAKYRSVNVPVFTPQLDTVQNSLLASIHNVFDLGNLQPGILPDSIKAMGIAGKHASLFATHPSLEDTGYSPADTLSAPAAVRDSLNLMSRRFEEASAQVDREALKEEIVGLAEKSSAARKEEDDEQL